MNLYKQTVRDIIFNKMNIAGTLYNNSIDYLEAIHKLSPIKRRSFYHNILISCVLPDPIRESIEMDSKSWYITAAEVEILKKYCQNKIKSFDNSFDHKINGVANHRGKDVGLDDIVDKKNLATAIYLLECMNVIETSPGGEIANRYRCILKRGKLAPLFGTIHALISRRLINVPDAAIEIMQAFNSFLHMDIHPQLKKSKEGGDEIDKATKKAKKILNQK